jgi:hypothetical protein
VEGPRRLGDDRALAGRVVAGLVVHTGADSYESADRIWAVPIIDL